MFDTMKATKVLAALAGSLLIFLLANWAAGSLYTVGGGEAHGGEEALAGEGEVHAVVQGYVIAAADDGHGEEEEAEAEGEAELAFADIYAAADADKGTKVFAKCKACHKLDAGAHATGPSLYGIVDGPIAGIDGFGYSEALLALAGGTWTPEELDAWLTKPKDYAPKNKMTFAGLKKAEDRANLIAYLATIGG